jgi:hypothetical protein
MRHRELDPPMPRPPTRRAELTFRHNASQGRHGWLRLTPAFSVKMVDNLLARTTDPLHVLDPFAGTATTMLCAAMRGYPATGLDINPFLVWFANAKVATYDGQTLAQAAAASRTALRALGSGECAPAIPPPIFNIQRWWKPAQLDFLCRLRGAIAAVAPTEGHVRDLLMIAFCRTMISLSNAAFNHQSMSFKAAARESLQGQLFGDSEVAACETRFAEDVALVLAGAAENPIAAATIRLADARSLAETLDGEFDLLITSPPYPNRMSYIRELRPYMYWLGYLNDPKDAGELDCKAIGGTWGVATSRVANWRRNPETYSPEYLPPILDAIRSAGAKSGAVLAAYVGKYFEDMWQHITSALKVMRRGGELHYIVGNSKFYDVLVPVEAVYRDMLLRAGAAEAGVVSLRKRNSKKELLEFDVVAVA